MPSVDTKAVEREVKINAKPETVFDYLVDYAKVRRWMSVGGRWDPKVGNSFQLEMTSEDVASGKFVAIERPSRLVVTWGWEGEDAVTKPGSSTVEFTLRPEGSGTILKLVHRDLLTPESAEQHSHGWEHYLDRLAVASAGGDPGPDKFQED